MSRRERSMDDLVGKRKRQVAVCPNPLFVHWLTEWKNDAAEKGLKTQYTYGKALKTLLKYPLQLQSGKECNMLENFGAKICEMLDNKLQEYIALYGTTEPLPGVIDEKLCRTAQGGPKRKRAKPAPKTGVHDNTNAAQASSSAQRKTPKKNSPYIPKYRSGPYALILTLHVKMQDGVPFMSKRDVMVEAQPLANASFTVPDPGSRYTAWSSMGSLISKGYVIKNGNPPRYGLTEEGMALAQRISNHKYEEEEEENGMIGCSNVISTCNQGSVPDLPVLANGGFSYPSSVTGAHWGNQPPQKRHEPKPLKQVVHTLSDSDDDEDPICVPLAARLASDGIRTPPSVVSQARNMAAPSPASLPAAPKVFQFCFVSENGEEVTTKDAAAVTVDEEISVGFKIRCDYDDLIASGKRYKLLPGRSCNNQVSAYIHNDDIPELSPDKASLGSPSITVARSHPNSEYESTVPVKSNYVPQSSAGSDYKRTAKPSKPNSESDRRPFALKKAKSLGDAPVAAKTTSVYSRPQAAKTVISDESTQDSLQSLSQDSTASYSSDMSEPNFQFFPGSFEIVLCIDNHEQYGKGKFNKQMLSRELERHGIAYDVRLLQVGDFLWIARPKGHRLVADQSQELVLDYVIERKRIDDMASSIIDGRFKEQKFRLKSCGLGVPMLLVEDLPNSYCSIPHKTLMQAATNTQVIDKFQIVKTKDLKDSFNYLINMTKFLQRTYQFKTLKAHSKTALQSCNVVNQPQDAEMRLMTFTDFNKGSAKIKPLSVREAFARQLVCIHGITPEKVAVVLAEYPTPASLRNAYKDCDSENDKEMLLSLLKMPKTNKRVVLPQVSKHIYKLMTAASAD